MLTYEDLKTKLATLGWSPDLISRMNSISTSFGLQTLYYLYNNVDEYGEKGRAELILLLEKFPKWRSQIETGSQTDLLEELGQVLRSGRMNQIELMSYFVYDIHSNPAFAVKVEADLDRSLFLYQFANLEELPAKEIEFGLVHHAADLALVVDLESELKRFAYYKNYSFDAKELKKFRAAVANCDQLLTESQLTLGGVQVAGTVKNFIQDFSEFTASLPASGSSYAVANYITNSPTMKLLNKYGVGALRRILEIYVWLLEGNYTTEEIKAYEAEREDFFIGLANLVTGDMSSQPEPPALQPAQMPAPESVPELTPIKAPEPVVQPTPEPAPLAPSEPQEIRRVSPQPSKIDAVNLHHPEPVIPNKQSPLTDNAKIHELINRKRPEKIGVIKDDTNIVVADEKQRLEQQYMEQEKDIQKKLDELKIRNKD